MSLLNLTSDTVVLVAEDGTRTEIPPSGYVARVEATRRVVDEIALNQRYLPEGGAHYDGTFPLVEETPRDIAIDCGGLMPFFYGTGKKAEDMPLLIVDQHVAEDAKATQDPLTERMVWVSDPVKHTHKGQTMPCDLERADTPDGRRYHGCYRVGEIIGYRALQRVPK